MPPFLSSLVRQHLAALRMLLLLSVITGVAYPMAILGIAQGLFPHQANGSLIKNNGKPVASSLIGQNFTLRTASGGTTTRPDPRWFQPRPPAAGTTGYDPTVTGASNLGPNDPGLVTTIKQRRAAVAAFDGVPQSRVPADALTSSGSGLDPDISRTYAHQQVARVARARGLSVEAVRMIVDAHVKSRDAGFLGQEAVNVLEVNHALTRLR